ncbi:hypothetical protein GO755_04565 [Spirosoma sp. HMF4905]|uniref:DUF5681 domain-containing protein n=1 Tax=Spirosoma arboris TaxID=2682092 RepID=A0A7K1S6C7_9BACT|nr:DUF5681 domain-containing protein [Spirosoma arboris]MVM29295.1 hypothetical protein [Spirosoma arboris]
MNRPGRNGGTLRDFPKGQSGNPAGRPPKQGTISQLMKQLGQCSDLELSITTTTADGQVSRQSLTYSTDGDNTLFAIVAMQLIYRALRGDINAFKVLLDRTEGRVPRPVKSKSGKPSTGQLESRTDGQIQDELRELRTRRLARAAPNL